MSIKSRSEQYAANNYPSGADFLEKSPVMDIAFHLGRVRGDTIDSFFSPLRIRCYTAVGEKIGALTTLGYAIHNSSEYFQSHDVNIPTVLAMGGAAVATVLVSGVRHKIETGIRSGTAQSN